jgi:hypothetical protein
MEQRPPGQKIDCAITSIAGERRIEIALVIHRQNDRPALNHAFAMQNSKPKKEAGEKPGKVVTDPVVKIHLNGQDIKALGR